MTAPIESRMPRGRWAVAAVVLVVLFALCPLSILWPLSIGPVAWTHQRGVTGDGTAGGEAECADEF